MQIAIIGASGLSGMEITKAALAEQHHVIAVVRNPSKMEGLDHPNLETRTADIYDTASLAQAFAGADVVVSAVGSGGLFASHKPTTVYSRGMGAIVPALRNSGVRRLLVISSGGAEEHDPAEGFIFRKFIKPYIMETYIDIRKMETYLRTVSDLDWTVVRPPMLKNGKAKGRYRLSETLMPQGGWQIRRADLAEYLLTLIGDPDSHHRFLTIAY